MIETAVAVAVLILLITYCRWQPFLAITVAALLAAILTGLSLPQAVAGFSAGVGKILGPTALVIGCGAILGSLLAETGGAALLAEKLTGLWGRERLAWAMFTAGILVGIGTWFTVGLVLLVPVAFSFLKLSDQRLLPLTMGMLAALSAMHGLVPPHPGPLAAIATFQADVGQTVLWGLLLGVIAAAAVGPGCWLWRRMLVEPKPTQAKVSAELASGQDGRRQPTLFAAIACILLPVVLMLQATVVKVVQVETTWLRDLCLFAGDPIVSMLAGTLLAMWLLGRRCGLTRAEVLQVSERSLLPVANVLLVVGAGAGFSTVLIESGVAKSIESWASAWEANPLLIGWMVAAAIRVATGSATTAITTAAGLMSGVVLAPDSDVNRELLVVTMGAGSLTLSHVNDGGFWFVKEYFGLTVGQTLRTWTVLETMLSLVVLLLAWICDWFV